MKTDAVQLGPGPVCGPVYNLQKPQPQDQDAEKHQDKQRGIPELFVKDSYGCGIKI